MEQAVNLFSKGLQLDTNPMVQGNDSLSDALNATFITMNGNEVMLLNDMGNRRIDNALLPPGYEPVGMKEYGGVIYVAAYNPTTNRSQIGSFPSPERRIGEEVKDLSAEFSFGIKRDSRPDNYNFTYTTEKGINYLKEDSLLVPLTKDTSLHTGDKFSVYCSNLWIDTAKSLLTNFDNIVGNKLKSPKNRRFTLSLGILNSQNEFVDITSSLERWNDDNEGNNKIIEFEDSVSDLYKFNSGYFIAKNEPEGIEHEASDDRTLIKNRLSMAVNTYSYKLIGPLYLKVNYNHITSISYSMNGSNTGTESNPKAELELTVHIEYNCPDGLSFGNLDKGDNIYEHYEIPDSTPNPNDFNFFYFYTLLKDILNDIYYYKQFDEKGPGSKNGIITYNPITNLYSVDIVNYYNNVSSTEGSIIKYLIGIPATINNDEYFIKGLSKEGQIDINLLGSGLVLLEEWRFVYNEKNKEGTISYGFEAYPKIGHSFKNFLIKFIKCLDDLCNYDLEGNIISDPIPSSVTENIGWILVNSNLGYGTYSIKLNLKDINNNSVSLENNTMYNVYIRYLDCIGDSCSYTYYNIAQWFVTSDIFNNQFDLKFNYNKIKTYNISSDIEYTLKPEINIDEYNESIVNGSLFSLSLKNEYIINNPIKFSAKFSNKNMSPSSGKVPENIEISSSNNSMKITFPSIENTVINVKDYDGTAEYDGYLRTTNIVGERTINNEGEIIEYTGQINQFMYAKGLSSPQSFIVEHNFINFGDYLGSLSKENWFKSPWIGIESYKDLMTIFGVNSSFVVKKSTEQTLEAQDSNYQRYTLYRFYKIGNGAYDKVELKQQNNLDILNNAFNSLANSDLTFIVADSGDWFLNEAYVNEGSGAARRHCCLVWMRYRNENDVEDKWMLLCEIVVTHGNDVHGREYYDDPRIDWGNFTTYLKGMNYYSDFSNNTGSTNVYVYDKNNKLLIEELLWNINLNILYSAKLSLSDDLNETKRRVKFQFNDDGDSEITINKSIEYPININSSQLKNNVMFLDYINNKIAEVEAKTIDCYCTDAPTAGNLKTKHLYKITSGNATEVGIPNPNGDLPYFPVVTNKNPKYIMMEEEEIRDLRLDLRGIPVIEGFRKYSNYNQG